MDDSATEDTLLSFRDLMVGFSRTSACAVDVVEMEYGRDLCCPSYGDALGRSGIRVSAWESYSVPPSSLDDVHTVSGRVGSLEEFDVACREWLAAVSCRAESLRNMVHNPIPQPSADVVFNAAAVESTPCPVGLTLVSMGLIRCPLAVLKGAP